MNATPPKPRIRPRVVHLDMSDWASEYRPATPVEAVMMARFGDEPEVSQVELLAIRDLLVDALDALPQRERWVFLGHLNDRKSFGIIAAELNISRPYAFLLWRQAIQRMQEQLRDHTLIRPFLSHDSEPGPAGG